jgi:hypothetical protein
VAADDVHRLRDILVEEVSLVDRAANKRRFLLVKREGDMSELRSNGRGGLTRVVKADDDDEEPEDAEKAKKKPPFGGNKAPPFGKKPPEPPTNPQDDDDDDEDEEKKRKAAAADDEDEDEEKRKAAAGAADLSDKLGELAEEIQDVADKMDDDEEDDDDPPDAKMKKLLRIHKRLGIVADAYLRRMSKSAVAKIGRKMSASRLATYKEALATLQSLLSDLMDSPKKEKDHDPDPGDPQLAASGWKPANPSSVPANGTGAAAIKAIESTLSEFATLVKSQQTKISRLEKGIVPSNALTVDRGGRSRSDDVVWPTDLNARAHGDKSVSFLDD